MAGSLSQLITALLLYAFNVIKDIAEELLEAHQEELKEGTCLSAVHGVTLITYRHPSFDMRCELKNFETTSY